MERKGKRRVRASAFLIIGMSATSCAEAQDSSVLEAPESLQTSVYEENPVVSPTTLELPKKAVRSYPTPSSTEDFIEPTLEVNGNSEVANIPYDANQTIAVIEHHNPSYGVNDGEYGPAYMTKEVYEAQLQYLKNNGFYTPSEEEILGWLEGKHGLPQKSVIFRIDLGLPRKDYEEGFQLLEEYGFRAVLFVLTAHIPDESSENKVGWDTIKNYVDRGILIPGSHGTYHPDYSEIPENEAKWDALNAKAIIEDKLEREIYFFAYPYDSEAHEEILLKYFKMLFGSYKNRAFAGSPLVGTRYPYVRGGEFDWEKFESELLDGIGGK